MKQMTCNELGGACDCTFEAESFEEIAQLSRNHGIEMLKNGDAPQRDAMNKMQELMQDPKAMQDWMDEKRALFAAR